MSKWLASVQSLEEAHILLPALPDILDMKDPSKGALGALSIELVTEIVMMIDGRCKTSATIGDLPMQTSVLSEAIKGMAQSGVDYVKIGLFPEANLVNCIIELKETIKILKTPVIAVIFADMPPKEEIMAQLEESGFHGVMVDTAIKNGQHLPDHWSELTLGHFVNTVHEHNMLCGLAGALRVEDIPLLKPLDADYLGFRSALCNEQQRTSILQLSLAEKVQNMIQ
jgi:uncharacterized protein (UPF0264 family)